MNIQTLHKQRLYILIAAAVGIISLFLPWATLSAEITGFGIKQSLNGFHGYGIAVFLALAATIVISLAGKHENALDKNTWLFTIIAGTITLLFTVIFLMNVSYAVSGYAVAKTGFGVWIALIASLAVVSSAWLFKSAGAGFKTGVDTLKKSISIPVTIMPAANTNSGINEIAELEKLSRLKENGSISEEEFQQLKSKLL